MTSTRALHLASGSWLAVAALGQCIFATYVAGLYGLATVRGDWAKFGKVMPHGFIPNDPGGNAAIIAHVLLAVYVLAAGFLQIWPAVRKNAPVFHRWNGRIYLALMPVISLTGLYMMWTRGTVGDLSQHLSTSFNGVLILWFTYMAYRTARARNFQDHQRWALRLYLAGNGVWFFRVFLMFWLLWFRRPVGFDPHTFSGPALTAISVSQYLLPLAVLELYLRSHSNSRRWAVAALLAGLTLITAAGTFAATMGMWLPRL